MGLLERPHQQRLVVGLLNVSLMEEENMPGQCKSDAEAEGIAWSIPQGMKGTCHRYNSWQEGCHPNTMQ